MAFLVRPLVAKQLCARTWGRSGFRGETLRSAGAGGCEERKKLSFAGMRCSPRGPLETGSEVQLTFVRP